MYSLAHCLSSLQSGRHKRQNILRAFPSVVHIFCNRLPYGAVMRFGSEAALDNIILMVLYEVGQLNHRLIQMHTTRLCTVLLFELQPPAPNIPDVRICLDRTLEPLTGFLNLALGPKQPSNRTYNKWVIRGFAKSIC